MDVMFGNGLLVNFVVWGVVFYSFVNGFKEVVCIVVGDSVKRMVFGLSCLLMVLVVC